MLEARPVPSQRNSWPSLLPENLDLGGTATERIRFKVLEMVYRGETTIILHKFGKKKNNNKKKKMYLTIYTSTDSTGPRSDRKIQMKFIPGATAEDEKEKTSGFLRKHFFHQVRT